MSFRGQINLTKTLKHLGKIDKLLKGPASYHHRQDPSGVAETCFTSLQSQAGNMRHFIMLSTDAISTDKHDGGIATRKRKRVMDGELEQIRMPLFDIDVVTGRVGENLENVGDADSDAAKPPGSNTARSDADSSSGSSSSSDGSAES